MKPHTRSKSPAAVSKSQGRKSAAKTKAPALLTLEEVNAMRILLCKDDPPEANNSLEHKLAQSDACDPAILHALKLIGACDTAIEHYTAERWHRRPPLKVCLEVFDLCLDMVLSKDAKLAEYVSILLRARREGKQVGPKDLGVKQKPGRKSKPHDLKFIVPAAIKRILEDRTSIFPYSEQDFRRRRITRKELVNMIFRIGEELSSPDPVTISNTNLSTYINKYGISRFMHDPHRPVSGELPPPSRMIVV